MAKRRVWSGGDNTGGADNTNWAQASQTWATALLASSAGDIILIHKTHQEEHGVDTQINLVAGVDTVVVDKDAGEALAVMGTDGWIGNSTTSRNLEIGGGGARIKGITLRTAGASSKNFFLNRSDGGHIEYEDLYLWAGNNTSGASPRFSTNADTQGHTRLINPTFRFGSTAHSIIIGGSFECIGGGVSAAGSAVTTLVAPTTTGDTTGTHIVFMGFNASYMNATATLVANSSVLPAKVIFDRCILPATFTPLATQGHANLSSVELFILDCDSADFQGRFGHYTALGFSQSDTTIYLTAGVAGQSWFVETTPAASASTPYRTPRISMFHPGGGSAITPRFEVLREGSTTPYNDDELWAEWTAKIDSGFTLASYFSDRMPMLATPAAQATGAGTGAWTGASGTAWSGKCDSGSAITVAEAGDICGQVCFARPNSVVRVNPQPLTT